MDIREQVANVRRLSDEDLLAGLGSTLGSSRSLMALVIAHLGEVEERRLQLLAGYESMFAYCTRRLGMSEDEACRRIEVARLARRFPVLFERLAAGRVSLSVAALLKAHLDEANHVALLAAVSGKTVNRAREVLATWFPRPDVVASIRKLPGSGGDASGGRGGSAPSTMLPFESDDASRASDVAQPSQASASKPHPASALPPQPAAELVAPERPHAPPLPPARRTTPSIEALSPERYHIQLTADAELKRKLDLARDLLRHAVPRGDLATLIGRALDLLIEKTLQRRFGQARRKRSRPADPRGPTSEASSAPGASAASAATVPPNVPAASATTPSEPTTTVPATTVPATSPGEAAATAMAAPCHSRHSRHLPNDVRRAVLERDGLRCTWQGPDGTRCNSRAWLEFDHLIPRGLGGTDDPENIRPLCRSHNRLAAEQAYGRATITRVIAQRQADDNASLVDVAEA